MSDDGLPRFKRAALCFIERTGGRRKRVVAETLIVKEPFALSAQVLQEYIANALRKTGPGDLRIEHRRHARVGVQGQSPADHP